MRRNWTKRLWAAVIAGPLCIGLGACSERLDSETKAPEQSESSKNAVETVEEELSYEILMQRATVYVDAGQPARALSRYASALALRPGDPEALFGRGLARLKLRDAEGAIRDLEEALAAEPTFADAAYVLAEAHRYSASLPEAKVQYERYLELDPDGRYAKDVRSRLAEYGPAEP